MKNSLLDRALAAGAGGRKKIPRIDVKAHLKALRPRLDLLPVEDRLFVETVMTRDWSIREFAKASGQDPGTLTRRYWGLYRRLHDPILDVVLDGRLARELRPEIRQIAVEHFLLGMTVCALSDKHRMTKGQIQSMLDYVRGFADREGK